MNHTAGLNPYVILKVSTMATVEDIKEAYRLLANEHHPDKGGSREQFEKLTWARDVLLDPERRAQFDVTGEVAPDGAANQEFKDMVTTLGQLLTKVVHKCITQLGQEPTQQDLVAMMLFEAEEAEDQLRKQLKQYRQGLARAEKLRGRFTGPEGRPDYFAETVDGQIRELRKLVVPMEQAHAAMARVVDYLEGCKFRKEEVLPWTIQ